MIGLYDVASIRRAEEQALAAVPPGALMQRAAFALHVTCAGLLARVRGQVLGSRVVLLVGAGNNGGDALWAGAFLARRGCEVTAVAAADRVHELGARALRRAGGRILAATDSATASALRAADLVVDGLLGIGGSGALREPAASLAAAIGQAVVVAVDLPSGVDADTGAVNGAAIDADVTVTFGALKPGLVLAPGRLRAGTVRVVDIGLELGEPTAWCLSAEDVEPQIAQPREDAYKYTRAVAGLVTGSAAYPGAAMLSVAGAQAANTGMVRYLDRPGSPAHEVVTRFWDVVVDAAAPADQGRVTAWGCGSGLTGSTDEEAVIAEVLASAVPVVLDAGALVALGRSSTIAGLVRSRHDRGLPTVLTPHDGEFERLVPGVLSKGRGRLAAARAGADAFGAVMVLKGPGTVVAAPGSGARSPSYVDTEATADLAVAGSGDVLTGLVTAVLAGAWADGRRTIYDAAQAAAAAVFVHGRAGRIAAEREHGGPATASGVADAVPAAIASVRRSERQVGS